MGNPKLRCCSFVITSLFMLRFGMRVRSDETAHQVASVASISMRSTLHCTPRSAIAAHLLPISEQSTIVTHLSAFGRRLFA
jgi:hypothetical protein